MTDKVRRILVMGSRDFPNEKLVWSVLERLISAAHVNGERIVFVHGDCPTGVDAFAVSCVTKYMKSGFDVALEAHPADWDQFGNAAGPIRNRQMAERGAEQGLAFWDGRSPGTLDGIRKANKHHIVVTVYSTASQPR